MISPWFCFLLWYRISFPPRSRCARFIEPSMEVCRLTVLEYSCFRGLGVRILAWLRDLAELSNFPNCRNSMIGWDFEMNLRFESNSFVGGSNMYSCLFCLSHGVIYTFVLPTPAQDGHTCRKRCVDMLVPWLYALPVSHGYTVVFTVRG